MTTTMPAPTHTQDTKPVSRIVQHADRVKKIKVPVPEVTRQDCSRFERGD